MSRLKLKLGELIVVGFLVAVIGTTSYFNLDLIVDSKNDKVAERTLVKIRDALYQEIRDNPSAGAVKWFHLKDNALPKPFDNVELPDGITLNYLISVKRRRLPFIMLSLSHASGSYEFRWIDIYGSRRLQKIKI